MSFDPVEKSDLQRIQLALVLGGVAYDTKEIVMGSVVVGRTVLTAHLTFVFNYSGGLMNIMERNERGKRN